MQTVPPSPPVANAHNGSGLPDQLDPLDLTHRTDPLDRTDRSANPGGMVAHGPVRRSVREEQARSTRSWALHGAIAAAAAGAVVLDRRIRRTRYGDILQPMAAATVALAYEALLAVVQLRHPHDEQWRPSRSELATDVACFGVNMAAGVVATVVGEAVGHAGGERRRLRIDRLPAPVGAAISILAFDLFHSRFHQLLHVWGPGWRFRAVHHSSKGLYFFNASKVHPVEFAVDVFAEGVITGRLGLSREQLVLHQAVRFMYGALEHSNIDLRSGPLDHVFSTPDLHRWHHSTVYEEGDANYGVVTSLWDKLFGTWRRPDDRESPDELGVGRMPDFPSRFRELQRVPLDWQKIRERNAASWGTSPETAQFPEPSPAATR